MIKTTAFDRKQLLRTSAFGRFLPFMKDKAQTKRAVTAI
jgi:hypothetical protein